MSTSTTDISKYVLERNPSPRTNTSMDFVGEGPAVSDFPVYRLATVVDIILDVDHPFFGKSLRNTNYINTTTVNQQIPINYKDGVPNLNDLDYSYIGRARIRFESERNTPTEQLPWAIPLDNTIIQYPLLNEQVFILKVHENLYYTKPFSRFNFCGVNVNFTNNERKLNPEYLCATPFDPDPFRQSYTTHPKVAMRDVGYLGKYFILNPYIRSVKKYEGDTVVESRFGQSIRFTAYDENRLNDQGSVNYSSYKLNTNLFSLSKNGGFGNPRIVIRNRQRNIAKDTAQPGLHRKLPQIQPIKEYEKNYGGLIEEDINNDGSTIEINSGATISKWQTTVYKQIFGVTVNNKGEEVGSEEQQNFNPKNSTSFKFPSPLNGDQIIINTDRLILSSRLAETLHFSKRRYAVATDSEYTVDANDQIVLTTNRLTCLNAPQIFLGQYGETNEPALLGQTTVDWLYDLCDWLLEHVHWYHHVHPHPHVHYDAGKWDRLNTQDANPDQTQLSVQQLRLKLLRDSLHRTMSRRVFLTGGGYAPGSNGVKPIGSEGDCKEPVVINKVNGAGVVGTFKGRNRREGPVEVVFKYENEPDDTVLLQQKLSDLNSLKDIIDLPQGEQLKDIYQIPIKSWVNNLTTTEATEFLNDTGVTQLMNKKGVLGRVKNQFGI